jgi:hypothetical protein
MKTLQNVLETYAHRPIADLGSAELGEDDSLDDVTQIGPGTASGSQDGQTVGSSLVLPFDTESLRRDLESVRHNYEGTFRMCMAMMVILYVVVIVVALFNISDAVKIGGLSVSGVGAPTLVNWMLKVAREERDTNRLLAIATSMDAETARAFIQIMRS